MELPRAEQALASTIQYLLDGIELDAARVLMSCSLIIRGPIYGEIQYSEWSQTYDQGAMFVAALTCPRSVFEDLQSGAGHQGSLFTEIAAALNVIVPQTDLQGLVKQSKAADGTIVVPQAYVQLDPRPGLPDTLQRAKVREMLRAAREDVELPDVDVRGPGLHVALRPNLILPTGKFTRRKRLCFVVMPFASEFDEVFGDGIKPAVESAQFNCLRADDIMRPGDILKQIWQSLIEARVVIADITGNNGNVMYEVGLAHVIGQDVILLTQDAAKVPFDLRQQRLIPYGRSGEGLRTLQRKIPRAIEEVVAATAAEFS